MLTEKIQLEADEEVIFQVRKHWFIPFIRMFGICIVAILPLVAYITLTQITTLEQFDVSISTPLAVALYAGWLLLAWMTFFNVWTNYYLDIWTLTSKRLIAVDQKNLFHRHTGSFRLERLQDMNVEFHGIIETLLDFGTLEADTAGESLGGHGNGFRVRGLPHPRELKAEILKASDALMRRYHGYDAGT